MPFAYVLVASHKHTGAGAVAFAHVRALSDAGWRVALLCPGGGNLAEDAAAAGYRIPDLGLRLDSRGLEILSLPADVRRLRAFARQEPPDLVVCHRDHDHLAAGLAFGRRVPVWRYFRLGVSGPAWRRRAFWLRRAAGVLHPDAPFPGETDEAAADAKLRRVWVPAGVDADAFAPDAGARDTARARLGFASEDVVVAMPARVKRERNHALFLEAFARAAKVEPRLRGLLLGDNTKETDPDVHRFTITDGERTAVADLHARAGRLGVAGRVTYWDAGPHFRDALAAADVGFLWHPGTAGTGRGALELMAMGRPVILPDRDAFAYMTRRPELAVCRVDGAPDAVDDATAGSVAERWVALARDVELRRRTGLAARDWVREAFDRRALAARLAATFGPGS